MKTQPDISAMVDEIFGLYERFGADDYIGEPVSQLEHMAQSAQMAQKEGFGEEVILAAFFHDIGHFCVARENTESMDGFGTVSHEKIGADYLRKKGFSEKIARLVENHVQAKRYLTYKYPAYYDKLSEGSKKTLGFQGGRMTGEEAEAFEGNELFTLSIKMREWDERAKEENTPLPDLNPYREMSLRHLANA